MLYDNRPRILHNAKFIDRFLEFSGWAVLLAFWSYLLVTYKALPDKVPLHFSTGGVPTTEEGKVNLLVLAVVATVIFIGLSFLNRIPFLFNYPVSITPENASFQYRLATRLIRLLKMLIVCIFFLIALSSIWVAEGRLDKLPNYFLVIILGLIFLPIATFLVVSKKNK